VRSSNAGHLLMTGIASVERCRLVAAGLMGPDCFTGWGIRTLAADEVRYNPMAYHNGTVWPHDNAMIALGMARIGLRAEAVRLFEGLYAAASMMDLRRMPELFCGFPRRPGRAPTAFPVACAPQAWAAATIPAFVQACVGLRVEQATGTVRFDCPHLPAFLDNVTWRNLSVGNGRVSVAVSRTPGGASVSVLEQEGDVHVVTTT
jgi:glycogen debranching enzyme